MNKYIQGMTLIVLSFVTYEQYIEYNTIILASKIVPILLKALASEKNDHSFTLRENHYL
jgi:hypothetical protein